MQKQMVYNIGFKTDMTGINEALNALKQFSNITPEQLQFIDPTKTQADLQRVKDLAGQVGTALQASFNPKLNTVNVQSFNNILKNSGLTIQQIQASFSSMGSVGTNAFNQLTSSLLKSNSHLKESHGLLESMGKTLVNTVKWSIASSAINGITSAVRNAWNYVINLDRSLNDIRVVTDRSAESMEKFAKKANNAAKALGSSTKAYTEASLIYFQQGLGDQDVQARTEATIKAANVTGQSAKEVSEQLTAVWNGYKVVADEAEKYVDKLAAVAASTASDLEELSDGMSKVASAASTMGVDVDQLSAQLSTIISVTRQDASSVGTALKTIYARMGDLRVDGIDEFGTTLGDVSGQMKQMGIDVLDQQGNLRDMGEVIEDVAGKWGTWTDAQRQAAAVAIAGKRQYNNLIALFDNWDMYESALMTSQSSEGTLERQQSIYMESLEGHLKQLSVAGEKVYSALFDSDSMKDMIDGLTSLVSLVGDFVEGIGGGGNLLLMLGPLFSKMIGKHLGGFVATSVANMQSLKEHHADLQAKTEVLNQMRQKGIEGLNSESASIQRIIKLKEKQLKIDRFLTDEQRKQNDAIIDQALNLAVQQKEVVDQADARHSDAEGTTSQVDKYLGEGTARVVSAASLGAEGQTATEQDMYANRNAYAAAQEEVAEWERNARRNTKREDRLAETQNERLQEIDKIKGKSHLTDEDTQRLGELEAEENEYDKLQKQHERYKTLTATTEEGTPPAAGSLEALRVAAENETATKGQSVSIDTAIRENKLLSEKLELLRKVTAEKTKEREAQPEQLTILEDEGQVLAEQIAKKKKEGETEDQPSEETSSGVQLSLLEESTEATEAQVVARQANVAVTKKLSDEEKQAATILAQYTDKGKASSAMHKKLKEVVGGSDENFEILAQTLEKAARGEDLTEDEAKLLDLALSKLDTTTDEAAEAVKKDTEALKANKDASAAVVQQKKVQEDAEKRLAQQQKASQTVQNITAIAGAAMACMNIWNQFQSLGDLFSNQDMSEEEKTKQMVSTVLSIVMSLLGVVGSLIPVISSVGTTGQMAGTQIQAGFWPILVIGLIIMAIMVAIVGIFSAINHAMALSKDAADNGKKAFEDASEAVQKLNEHLENTKKKYEELKEAFEEHDSMTEALEDMVRGSEEWYEQISKINDQALQMITEFPELAKYLETTKDGVMTFSEEGQEAVLEAQKNKVSAASRTLMMGNVTLTQAKNNKITSSAADELFKSSEYTKNATGRAVGGLVSSILLPGVETLVKAGNAIADSVEHPENSGQNFLEAAANVVGAGLFGPLGGIAGGIAGGIVGLFTAEQRAKQYEQETDKAYSAAMSYLSTDIGEELLRKANTGDDKAMQELRSALVNNAGVNAQYVDALIANTNTLVENIDAYQANTQAILAQNTQLAQSYLSDNYAGFEGLDTDLQKMLSSSVATAMNPDSAENKQRRQDLEGDFANSKSGTRDGNAQQYAQIADIDYESYTWGDDGSVTFKMADGTEYVASASTMASTIVQDTALKGQQDKIDTITNAYNVTKTKSRSSVKKDSTTLSDSAPGTESILASMVGGKNADFSNLTPNQMADIISTSGIRLSSSGFNEKTAKAFFGFDDSVDLDALARASGYTGGKGDWLKALNTGYAEYQKAIEESQGSRTLNGKKTGGSAATQAGLYQNVDTGIYTLTQLQAIDNSYDAMVSMVGGTSDSTGAAYEAFAKTLTDPQDLLDFSNAFSEIDWTDPFALEQFIGKLNEYGIEMEGDAWEAFAEAFASADLSVGNMLKNLKSFKTVLSGALEVINDLEVGAEISAEDYKALVNLNPALAKNFVLGLNGYTYTGGIDADSLITNTLDPTQYADSVNKSVSATKIWESNWNTETEKGNVNARTDSFSQLSEEQQRSIFAIANVSYEDWLKEEDEDKRTETLNNVADFVFNSNGEARTTEEMLKAVAQTYLSTADWSIKDLQGYREKSIIDDELYTQFLQFSVRSVAENIGVNSDALESYLSEATDQEAEELHRLFTEINAFANADPLKPLELDVKAVSSELNKLTNDYEELVSIADLTENANQQIKLQKEQIQLEKTKIDLIDKELERQRKLGEEIYQTQLNEYGLSINYDQNGYIDTTAWRDRLNDQDIDEKEYENIMSYIEWADAYNERIDEAAESTKAIDDSWNSIIDIQSQIASKAIQIQIDLNDAQKEWNEFAKRNEKLSIGFSFFEDESSIEKIFNAYENYAADSVLMNNLLPEIQKYVDGSAKDIYSVVTDAGVIFKELAYQEGFEEILSNAKETFNNVTGSITQIYEGVLQTQEDIIKAYDTEIDKLTSINDIVTASADIWKIVGKRSSNYANQLNSYYETIAKNNLESYKLSMSKFADAQREYDVIMAMGENATEELRKTVTDNLASAAQASVNSLNGALTALNEQFSNSLTTIIDNAFKTSTGMDLNVLTEDWSRISKNDDRYLDEINSNYAISKLNKDIQRSIDETDNIAAQNKLKQKQIDLEEKLTAIRDKQGKLRQADIDRANAEYELTLRQIALEEAQKTAFKMKLTRDAAGNYSYQYVSDQDAVDKAKEDLEQAQNNLYNQDKNRLQGLVDEYYSIWSEYNEKLAAAEATGDEEQIRKIQEYYLGENGLLKNIQSELEYVAEDFEAMGTALAGPEWVSDFAQNVKDIVNMDINSIGGSIDNLITSTVSSINTISSDIETLLVGEDSPLTKATSALSANVASAEQVAEKTSAMMATAESAIQALPDLLENAQKLATALNTAGNSYVNQLKENAKTQEAALDRNTLATNQLTAAITDYQDNQKIDGSVKIRDWKYDEDSGIWMQDAGT